MMGLSSLNWCFAFTASLILFVSVVEGAAVATCDPQWLKPQAPAIAGCLLNPKGFGPCLGQLISSMKGPQYKLAVSECAAKFKHFKWPELRTKFDMPGYLPEQIWPFYRNISAYPLFTQNVKATCASKGCDPAFPQPGDVLTVRVQVFPGTRVPRTFIPGVVVMEVRDGKTCIGLPGRCKSPELWPPYRMSWGPRYFVAPGLDAWGYEHYFDLYPMKDAQGKTIGTTIEHHEFYTGITAPVLMPAPPKGLGMSALFKRTLMQQNEDMRKFIIATQPKRI